MLHVLDAKTFSSPKVVRFENEIEIELPWLRDLLDKNATSSAYRRASGSPRKRTIKRTELTKKAKKNNYAF